MLPWLQRRWNVRVSWLARGSTAVYAASLLFGPPARGPIHFGQKDRNIRCPHSPLVLPLVSHWKFDLQLSLSLFWTVLYCYVHKSLAALKHYALSLLQSAETAMSRLKDNRKSSRFLKIDITCTDKQMSSADVFWRLFTRIRNVYWNWHWY